MSVPPKPTDIEDAVNQLWYVVIGMNGDGLRSKVDRILAILEQKEKAEIAEKAVAKSETRGNERRKLSVREWALIMSTAIPTLLLCYLTYKSGFKP